ncbi:MAG: glycerol-3-phosphate acyltransferase [Proteobacteria bacterium]|nr:MAG: glycerol-3-phosphate acyltransferase [Pseudomonadota bacterium]QKK10766.1 MAG: glycerol-3-phosphate acyltransferase [Pseudomonadota bacterium]
MDLTQAYPIPLWLLLLMVAATLWALLTRLLIPSVRWFLRRRVNRVLDEISKVLDIGIRPFQLTKRQVLIDRLVYDTKVIEAVNQHAAEHNMPRDVVQAKVLEYAREIVPAFNAYIYFRVGYWAAKGFARLLYRVRVGFIEDDCLKAIDPEATVVFVMNHRSNMDYVLVSFLVAERTALSYAVGEWARVWLLQSLVRSMGAFFVRRNSGSALYRRVLERYIAMATQEGVCQAVFPEGGLSRDGALREPRLGILDYMMRNYDPEHDREIVFVPVGLNYDRTFEDRTLLRAMEENAERRSKIFVVKTTLRFIGHNLSLMLRSRWNRLGFAQVNFGYPVSARAFCAENAINFRHLSTDERFTYVQRLAENLMSAIAEVIPVLPTAVIAQVLIQHSDTPMPGTGIVHQAMENIAALEQQGVLVTLPRLTRAHNLKTALDMLALRHIIEQEDDTYTVPKESLLILHYYANTLAHRKTASP